MPPHAPPPLGFALFFVVATWPLYNRGDSSRQWTPTLKRELGWTPQIAFDEGLRETIDWIERSWNEVVQEPHTYVHHV